MKTLNQKIKLSGFFAVLFALLAFSPVKTQAQCPTIVNAMRCSVTLLIEAGYYGINPNAPCLLGLGYFIVVPANSSVPLNCMGQSACNVRVTLTAVGGSPVTPTAIDFSNTTPVTQPPAPCLAVAIPTMYYHSVKNIFIFK